MEQIGLCRDRIYGDGRTADPKTPHSCKVRDAFYKYHAAPKALSSKLQCWQLVTIQQDEHKNGPPPDFYHTLEDVRRLESGFTTREW
eukprot:5484666-Amphidinium_carterae.1